MGEAAVIISGVGVIGSWFTPSSIFIFLNLVIGTIFIMSRFAAPITQTLLVSPQVLLPLPSSLLKRVKSFNFPLQNNKHPQTELAETPCLKKNPQEPQLAPAPSLFEVSVSDEEEETETEGSGSEEEDTEGKRQLREEGEDEEEEEEEGEGEGVDAKADDFITMFKKQLRLQRVESNLSYEQMLQWKHWSFFMFNDAE